MKKPTHEEIAQRAHQIWQSRGSPTDADHHWLEAERELLSSAASAPSDSPAEKHAASVPVMKKSTRSGSPSP